LSEPLREKTWQTLEMDMAWRRRARMAWRTLEMDMAWRRRDGRRRAGGRRVNRERGGGRGWEEEEGGRRRRVRVSEMRREKAGEKAESRRERPVLLHLEDLCAGHEHARAHTRHKLNPVLIKVRDIHPC